DDARIRRLLLHGLADRYVPGSDDSASRAFTQLKPQRQLQRRGFGREIGDELADLGAQCVAVTPGIGRRQHGTEEMRVLQRPDKQRLQHLRRRLRPLVLAEIRDFVGPRHIGHFGGVVDWPGLRRIHHQDRAIRSALRYFGRHLGQYLLARLRRWRREQRAAGERQRCRSAKAPRGNPGPAGCHLVSPGPGGRLPVPRTRTVGSRSIRPAALFNVVARRSSFTSASYACGRSWVCRALVVSLPASSSGSRRLLARSASKANEVDRRSRLASAWYACGNNCVCRTLAVSLPAASNGSRRPVARSAFEMIVFIFSLLSARVRVIVCMLSSDCFSDAIVFASSEVCSSAVMDWTFSLTWAMAVSMLTERDGAVRICG